MIMGVECDLNKDTHVPVICDWWSNLVVKSMCKPEKKYVQTRKNLHKAIQYANIYISYGQTRNAKHTHRYLNMWQGKNIYLYLIFRA